MASHSHDFVESYNGPVAFGLDRQTDENTLVWYLQKFSDDTLIKTLIKRMSDEKLEELFSLITRLMADHLSEPEYHELFLKDRDP